MAEPVSDRHMAENEVIFRGFNERMLKWQEGYRQAADDENSLPAEFNSDLVIPFYCECSDEKCHERIQLSTNAYTNAHSAANMFAIICGHEVAGIEDVTRREPEYCVVTKHFTPPEASGGLNRTALDNSKK